MKKSQPLDDTRNTTTLEVPRLRTKVRGGGSGFLPDPEPSGGDGRDGGCPLPP